MDDVLSLPNIMDDYGVNIFIFENNLSTNLSTNLIGGLSKNFSEKKIKRNIESENNISKNNEYILLCKNIENISNYYNSNKKNYYLIKKLNFYFPIIFIDKNS
jgi:hypothetical protein